MDEARRFTLETQQALSRTLEEIRRAMNEARENMRIIEAGSARDENRIKHLERELTGAAARERDLRKALDQQKAEYDRAASGQTAAREESGRLKAQLEDFSLEREELQEKTRGFDRILAERMDLERQLADLAAAAAAQEEVMSDLEKKLRSAAESQEALRAELSRERALQRRLTDLSKERERMAGDLEEAQGAIGGLRAQLAAEEELREALEFNLEVARRAIRELKQTVC